MLKNQAIRARRRVAAARQGMKTNKKKVKLAGKPGSVVDSHSSGPHIAVRLKPPTRKLGGTRHRLPIRCCSGWRLPRFTPQTLRSMDSSLWPCSSPHGGRGLPVTLPCGARTFLCIRYGRLIPSACFRTQRLPSQLHRQFYHAAAASPHRLSHWHARTDASKRNR